MKDTFKSVKNDLNNDMYVMFSGTACQVAGLKRYLGKCDTSKLYTCDIACHGVPSPIIWKEYLKHCEKKFCGKVTKADFRDKTIGWNTHKEAIGLMTISIFLTATHIYSTKTILSVHPAIIVSIQTLIDPPISHLLTSGESTV